MPLQGLPHCLIFNLCHSWLYFHYLVLHSNTSSCIYEVRSLFPYSQPAGDSPSQQRPPPAAAAPRPHPADQDQRHRRGRGGCDEEGTVQAAGGEEAQATGDTLQPTCRRTLFTKDVISGPHRESVAVSFRLQASPPPEADVGADEEEGKQGQQARPGVDRARPEVSEYAN